MGALGLGNINVRVAPRYRCVQYAVDPCEQSCAVVGLLPVELDFYLRFEARVPVSNPESPYLPWCSVRHRPYRPAIIDRHAGAGHGVGDEDQAEVALHDRTNIGFQEKL